MTTRNHRRGEGGAALIITTMILILVGMLALLAIQESEQESTAGARSRSATRSLYAADAGVQLAMNRLSQTPPDLTPFDVDLADGANVQSRAREDTTPQAIGQAGFGEAPEGYSLNVGAGAIQVARIYRVNVTSDAGGGSTELEAKLTRIEGAATGY